VRRQRSGEESFSKIGAGYVTMNSHREQFIRKFSDKAYRDSFVAEHIYSRLPLKIRTLRESRGLSQKDLGERIGAAQTWVSKLEDPNYGKLTLSTLLRLASAFDVGLEVDFVPFSKVLDNALDLMPQSWQVPSFEDDVRYGVRRYEFGAQGGGFYRGMECTPLPRLGERSVPPPKTPRLSDRQWCFHPRLSDQAA